MRDLGALSGSGQRWACARVKAVGQNGPSLACLAVGEGGAGEEGTRGHSKMNACMQENRRSFPIRILVSLCFLLLLDIYRESRFFRLSLRFNILRGHSGFSLASSVPFLPVDNLLLFRQNGREIRAETAVSMESGCRCSAGAGFGHPLEVTQR